MSVTQTAAHLGPEARSRIPSASCLRRGVSMAYASKRVAEYVLNAVPALMLLVFLAPMMVLAALLTAQDGGPVLFGHTRIGRNGSKFRCWKFRSMTVDAAERLEAHLRHNPAARREWERDHKLRDDPRVTRWGAFMRKSSVDELPQLFNVLRGEMNLVGPRPIVEAEVRRYGRYIAHYSAVPPGITGLWQVSGRNDTTYRRRVAIDTVYRRTRCLRLDVWILLMTVSVVLTRKGSY